MCFKGGEMALTKNEMIDRIEGLNYKKTRSESAEVLETLLEIIKKSLENGDDVMVSNFGKFQVTEKKARKGRNPATNRSMILSARRVVTFRTSITLREKIQNGNK